VTLWKQILVMALWAGVCAMACTGQTEAGQTGQANVLGKVVQETSGVGIRKAVVELKGTAGEQAPVFSTSTDAAGQFQLEGVVAGQYTISVTRPGYWPIDWKPQDLVVTVTAGQDVTGLVYKMQAAGVIAGKIVDGDGDPLAEVSVSVAKMGKGPMPTENFPTESAEGEDGSATTNDLGEFRIANLRPGQYRVEAQLHGNTGPPPNPADKGRQKERAVYAVTYYPGALEDKQASAVRVIAGGTATANFSLLVSRAYHVSGTVGGAGSSTHSEILLVSTTGQVVSQKLQEGGRFDFSYVMPGTYMARIVEMNLVGEGQPPEVRAQSISAPIVVSNADVLGLVLQGEAGGIVTGKFQMDDGEQVSWKECYVSLLPIGEGVEAMFGAQMMPATGTVKEDGSFEIKNVMAGNYQLELGAQGDRWRDYYTKSVMQNGREVADTGFSASGETTLDVTVSAKGASIEGTVVDGKGQVVPMATVVTLPGSGKLARPDAYQSELADASGHFVMRGINPGEFVVVAIEGEAGNVRRGDFFEKFGGRGEKVELQEGEKKNITVMVVGEAGE
jgi:protocatechuate 3,4-dioxygenase beta subunit